MFWELISIIHKKNILYLIINFNSSLIAQKTYMKFFLLLKIQIINLNATYIIYVSCNTSTQARDVKLLMENGYKIKKFSIVDQFPHTHHIETIFILVKSEDNVS